MKIALIGNCQIESIHASLRVLLPDAEITLQHSWNIANEHQNLSGLKEHLTNYDLVLSHRFYNISGFDFDELLTANNVSEFPTLNFLSFHPDCVYLTDADSKKIVRSVLGDYNSGLTAYSYANAIPTEQCVRAFRDDVYQQINYYATWETSASALDAEFKRCGYSANKFLSKWVARKPFVHSINHPKLFAVHDLVVAALDKAGIGYRRVVDIEDFAADPLLNYAGWPIYEEIAQYYGVTGSYYFKGNVQHGNTQYIFDRTEFVERSYAAYEQAGVRRFNNELFLVWDKIGLSDIIRG